MAFDFQTKHIILTHLVNYYNPVYFLLVWTVVVIWCSGVNTQTSIVYTMLHSITSITLLLYNIEYVVDIQTIKMENHINFFCNIPI